MEKDELWQNVLADVELNTSRATFNTWFGDTNIQSIEDNILLVSVPNSFAKEWLENKFNKFILKSVRNFIPEVKDIKFIISQNKSSDFKIIKKRRVEEKEWLDSDSQFDFAGVDQNTNLNPKYTLHDFIVGSANELAHAAVTSVAKNLGTVYNPLFIYGGVGLGKTHLIQALGNEIARLNKNKVVKYVSSEKFTSELVAAIQAKEMVKFKEEYRKCDLLIIDDIQFIAGREKTQEEFFHTFNALYEKNKQIVISSDKSPKAISTLEDRLKSRFEGGMIADISYPDYETRLAIIKTKLVKKKVNLSNEIIEYVAQNFQKNIREMEGALNKIIIQTKINQNIITFDDVKKILQSSIHIPKKNISVKNIIQTVAQYYSINEKQLFLKTRKQEIVKPRQIIMYLLRDELGLSYPSIGGKIGGRDHTTIIHACEKISDKVKNNVSLADEINTIRQIIYNS